MSRKGSEFERHISRQLSLWWTQHLPEPRDDIYWRTSQSGGRATVRARKGKKTANQEADLCATDPIGQPLIDRVVIELKRGYNRNTIADLIDRPARAAKQKFEEWIEKISHAAKMLRKTWWLIVKRDRRDAVIYFPVKVATLLNKGYYDHIDGIAFGRLEEFLHTTHPDQIVEYL